MNMSGEILHLNVLSETIIFSLLSLVVSLIRMDFIICLLKNELPKIYFSLYNHLLDTSISLYII